MISDILVPKDLRVRRNVASQVHLLLRPVTTLSTQVGYGSTQESIVLIVDVTRGTTAQIQLQRQLALPETTVITDHLNRPSVLRGIIVRHRLQ